MIWVRVWHLVRRSTVGVVGRLTAAVGVGGRGVWVVAILSRACVVVVIGDGWRRISKQETEIVSLDDLRKESCLNMSNLHERRFEGENIRFVEG